MVTTFRRGSTWLVVGLLCATSLVVLLALQLRSLRAKYGSLQERERVLASGMYVPRLDLELADGGRAIIGAPPARGWQVLFVYNTTCPFCRASLAAWQEVVRRAAAPQVQVFGLSLDSVQITQRFVHEHHVTFRSAVVVDQRSRALLRGDIVPQTIVLNADGRVLLAFPGTLTHARADSVVTLIRQLVLGAPSVP
jgi:peroxiredoxin